MQATGEPLTVPDVEGMSNLAQTIHSLSVQSWGAQRSTTIIGRHAAVAKMLRRARRLAPAQVPVLINGETGTGKELIARALFLLAGGLRKPFVSVNCAQYLNEQIMASELFGHKKGSFTGAVSDHVGVFEAANGGFVFLDEVGELSPAAQGMLLRILGEGEIVPMGATRPRTVNVRVLAATHCDLPSMVKRGEFRADLYFRLRRLRIRVPPLRGRGEDWELIARHHLIKLAARHDTRKFLAPEAIEWLKAYTWPGNVRELIGCIETGFFISEGEEIRLCDVEEALESSVHQQEFQAPHSASAPGDGSAREICTRLVNTEASFWDVIYEPFMDREMNRAQVRAIISEGLILSTGSYKRLVELVGMQPTEYLRFMDFLRHHRLKPQNRRARRRRKREIADGLRESA